MINVRPKCKGSFEELVRGNSADDRGDDSRVVNMATMTIEYVVVTVHATMERRFIHRYEKANSPFV